MAQINVPESINKEIKNIITEYLSKKDYLDKDSYILLLQLNDVNLEEILPMKEELDMLKEMREKELKRASW